MDRIIEEKIVLSKTCELSVVNDEFASEETLLNFLLKYFY